MHNELWKKRIHFFNILPIHLPEAAGLLVSISSFKLNQRNIRRASADEKQYSSSGSGECCWSADDSETWCVSLRSIHAVTGERNADRAQLAPATVSPVMAKTWRRGASRQQVATSPGPLTHLFERGEKEKTADRPSDGKEKVRRQTGAAGAIDSAKEKRTERKDMGVCCFGRR